VQDYIISPSILAADFANLASEVTAVLDAGANWIHIDVMDNHYVPNLTIGPMVCKALRPYAKNALLDVHLMVKPVDEMIHAFAKAGADIIVFHPEASLHVERSVSLIKSYGLKAGIALNPATPLNYLDYILDKIDLVLVMSVNPGFGGQDFITKSLDKIRDVKRYLEKSQRDIILQVDGGVKIDNIGEIAKCGANAFVVGSAIFNSADYKTTINSLRNSLTVV